MEIVADGLDLPVEEPGIEVVLNSTGGIEYDYSFSVLANDQEQLIHIIPVAYIGDQLLVAVPKTAWHKKKANRNLPPAALKKAVTVEVVQASGDSMEEPQDAIIRIWMGFLDPILIPKLQAWDEDTMDLLVGFLDSDSCVCYPFAGGLSEAAQEHFAFLTAAEEPQVVGGSGLESMEARMERMETAFATMMSRLEHTLDGAPLIPSVMAPRAKTASAKKKTQAPDQRFPQLDPSVVAAAQSAGVEDSALMEMQRLMMASSTLGKMNVEPAMPKKKAAKKTNVLSESESEQDQNIGEAGVGSGGPVASGGGGSLHKAVQHLAEIVSVLTQDKVQKTRSSKIDQALDHVSSSGLSETGSLGSGKKTAAARRVLRQALLDSPEDISNIIERAMPEDLTSQTLTPGQPAPTLCARAWVEHRSKIGHWKTSAYSAWSAAGALDALVKGNVPACRARLCLLILMLDQCACDRGSWTLAAELSLEASPPTSVLGQHLPPATAEGESPFSRLLDPRWAEVALSHLRETEDFLVKRGKLGKKETPTTDPNEVARAKAKAKAKAAAQRESNET